MSKWANFWANPSGTCWFPTGETAFFQSSLVTNPQANSLGRDRYCSAFPTLPTQVERKQMQIWIDADAAPREAKELVFRASERLKIPVILVANQSIWIPQGRALISCVAVRDGANIADQYIVEHSQSGDLAITADIPLAALLVEKQVYVVDPRGEEYDDRNVSGRLAARDLFDAARGAGMEFSGPQPYSPRDRAAFASCLDRVLTRAVKRAARSLNQDRET
jgi:uncharacterized protein YaiI (UPF0178 family)